MNDFMWVNIVFLGRKQVLRGILRLRIVVYLCLADSKTSVAAKDFLIFMMINLILRQFIGTYEHLRKILLLELYLLGLFLHHICRVEAYNVDIVTASLGSYNFIEAVFP